MSGLIFCVVGWGRICIEERQVIQNDLIATVEEGGSGGQGHQGIHIGLEVSDFFDGVGIEIAATIKDYGECKKELDESIVWDLVHQEHGEDENGCGAEDGNDEFAF